MCVIMRDKKAENAGIVKNWTNAIINFHIADFLMKIKMIDIDPDVNDSHLETE